MQQENGVILAQKLAQLMAGSRLLRIAAVIVLPFIGVVAAFGIAPDTITEPVARVEVVQEVDLPAARFAGHADDGYWREERIQRGDTLAALLARLGVDEVEVGPALRSARAARSLYQLVPGRTVRALATADGRLLELRYQNGGNVLTVTRQADSLVVSEQPVEFETALPEPV